MKFTIFKRVNHRFSSIIKNHAVPLLRTRESACDFPKIHLLENDADTSARQAQFLK